jgi:hypothetical protein
MRHLRIYSPYQIDQAHAPAKNTLADLGKAPEIAAQVNGMPMFIAKPKTEERTHEYFRLHQPRDPKR